MSRKITEERLDYILGEFGLIHRFEWNDYAGDDYMGENIDKFYVQSGLLTERMEKLKSKHEELLEDKINLLQAKVDRLMDYLEITEVTFPQSTKIVKVENIDDDPDTIPPRHIIDPVYPERPTKKPKK